MINSILTIWIANSVSVFVLYCSFLYGLKAEKRNVLSKGVDNHCNFWLDKCGTLTACDVPYLHGYLVDELIGDNFQYEIQILFLSLCSVVIYNQRNLVF